MTHTNKVTRNSNTYLFERKQQSRATGPRPTYGEWQRSPGKTWKSDSSPRGTTVASAVSSPRSRKSSTERNSLPSRKRRRSRRMSSTRCGDGQAFMATASRDTPEKDCALRWNQATLRGILNDGSHCVVLRSTSRAAGRRTGARCGGTGGYIL
ncbi:unnamed protein product [Boreogadus saida]